jgi:hypothetical protein
MLKIIEISREVRSADHNSLKKTQIKPKEKEINLAKNRETATNDRKVKTRHEKNIINRPVTVEPHIS